MSASESAPASRPKPAKESWSWRSQAVRGLLFQAVAVALVLAVVLYLTHNTATNMKLRGIQSGFDFLSSPAGFDIGESLFAFDSAESYWRAYLVGFVNTLRVAVVGIVLTTILGTLIGVGRFSRNALIRGLCMAYVEFFRNIPVLLQLLMWYLLFTELLPASNEPLVMGPLFLSKGGLNFPIPVWADGHIWAAWGLLGGLLAALAYRSHARAFFEKTGKSKSRIGAPLALLLVGGLAGWLLGGAPTALNMPVQGEFAIENGGALTPEYLSVLLGLTIYTAAFVAEVVRGGIQSVSLGQAEAAAALGLSRGQAMRLVMLPQALRVIIPPTTNQYLNLTKNSSLAVAIGYPDVVSIANTAINQTGRAVECIAIIMLVYLSTSLLTSVAMNWYNNRSAIRER
ncbi:ABC transporter permease subunit [Rhodoferax sp. OV413]|uniref:amino acid ABC transporter permease n=1 Tax=Rhodoferax sp. OV413 TaxID=1855285 RepID=UPI0025DC9BE9|nr:ABC transporter permease subunit [Rhodoferax sp. OV413]